MDLMALVVYKGIARRVLLPISSEELAERFGYEGQEIEVTFDSIESLPTLNCEDLTLDLANRLAEKLEDVEDFVVLSVIETESSDPSYLISYDFDGCWVYRGVSTDRDFGKFLIEEVGVELSKEKLLYYFDYEKYGRDVRLSQRGIFVDKGCFIKRGFN